MVVTQFQQIGYKAEANLTYVAIDGLGQPRVLTRQV